VLFFVPSYCTIFSRVRARTVLKGRCYCVALHRQQGKGALTDSLMAIFEGHTCPAVILSFMEVALSFITLFSKLAAA